MDQAFEKWWSTRNSRRDLSEVTERVAREAWEARGASAGEERRSVVSALMCEQRAGESLVECVKRLLRELNEFRNAYKGSGVTTVALMEALRERGGAAGALGRAGLLFEAKGQDYNVGISRDDYFPLGLQSYAQMIWVKALRLVSFAKTPRAPKHEDISETLLDCINYCAFAWDWMQRQVNAGVISTGTISAGTIVAADTTKAFVALSDTALMDHLNNQSGIIASVFGRAWEQRFPWMAGAKDLRQAIAMHLRGGA